MAGTGGPVVYVIGAFDTKRVHILRVARAIADGGVIVKTVDIGTGKPDSSADVGRDELVAAHPAGRRLESAESREDAHRIMSDALLAYLTAAVDVGGVVALGGSSGAAMVAPALKALRVGVPRILASPAIHGDISLYTNAKDIFLVNTVTDIGSENSLLGAVLDNVAAAMVGMTKVRAARVSIGRPRVAFTMLGLSTAALAPVTSALSERVECLTFPGIAGPVATMTDLVASGDLDAVADCSPSDLARSIILGDDGAFSRRLQRLAQSGVPYVGAPGTIDFAVFRSSEASLAAAAAGRSTHRHNANVMLVATTVADRIEFARRLGAALQTFSGEVRYVLPRGGFSAASIADGPFANREADEAFVSTLVETFPRGDDRKHLVLVDGDIQSSDFAQAVIDGVVALAER